jgi:hypothetical protein
MQQFFESSEQKNNFESLDYVINQIGIINSAIFLRVNRDSYL